MPPKNLNIEGVKQVPYSDLPTAYLPSRHGTNSTLDVVSPRELPGNFRDMVNFFVQRTVRFRSYRAYNFPDFRIFVYFSRIKRKKKSFFLCAACGCYRPSAGQREGFGRLARSRSSVPYTRQNFRRLSNGRLSPNLAMTVNPCLHWNKFSKLFQFASQNLKVEGSQTGILL